MPPGRKARLEIDPELANKILTMVRAGAYPERAAVAAGVAERTHYLWQSKGVEEREHREAGKTPRKTRQCYLDYVTGLERAIAEAEVLLMGKAAAGGPAASASLAVLERRFPERWRQHAPGPVTTSPRSTAGEPASTGLDQLEQRRQQRRVKGT